MQIDYKVGPPVTNEELNALYADAWPGPCEERDFAAVLERSLVHVCAYRGNELVGFAYVAWDGGVHAFLLEPTVRSDLRRRGIGTNLLRLAVEAAREAGAEWLHVDYEEQLTGFYRRCGFRPTAGGLINLRENEPDQNPGG